MVQIVAFSAQLLSYIPINTPQNLIFVIDVGAIGGAIGSLILFLIKYTEAIVNQRSKDHLKLAKIWE